MLTDLRFALRLLSRERLLSAAVIVTIALAIGGSTAVFSVVSAVLLRDLPYPDSRDIYVMRAVGPDGLLGNVTRREFVPIYERENHPTVESAAIAWSQVSQIVGTDQRPHPTVRYGVTDRFFDVFAVRMALGRGFQPDELPGRLVLSHRVWRDVFGSDANIIGRRVVAEGQPVEVVGVAPADFEFPQDPGFWYLMRLGEAFDRVRAYRGFMKLRPGSTQAQIEREAARLSADLGPDPATRRLPVLVAQPMLEYVVGSLETTVVILFAATGVLLLIACINVTNLLLSRSAGRAREVALREALGAGRWRIVRQLVTESLVLVAIGGIVGVIVAAAGTRAFLALAPEGLPRVDGVRLSGAVLLFAVGLSVATGILVGLAPAWRLIRNELRSLISEGGRGMPAGGGASRLSSVLVAGEIALAVLLVIGAALLVRSYVKLTTDDPGFNPHGVLTVSLNVPGRVRIQVTPDPSGKPRYDASYAPMAELFRDLETRVAGVSGVQSVASTTSLPLVPGPGSVVVIFTLPGRPETDAGSTIAVHAVSPEYLRTMEMRLVSGRALSTSDQAGSAGAAMVNQAFVRQYLGGQDPLGQRIRWKDNRYVPTDTGFQFGHLMPEEVEVVGVVGDAKHLSITQPPEPAIFMSSEQFIFRRRMVLVRTSLERPEALVPAIRRELDAIDPQLGAQFGVYDTLIRTSLARERLGMTLLVSFGLVAMTLAAVGVYGLTSYSVTQRTGEIAVRSVMGASARQMLQLVLVRGLRLAVAGILLGAAGAFAFRRVLANQLYGVSPIDPLVFVVVSLSLLAVAAIACLVPALRAARIDPITLLRSE